MLADTTLYPPIGDMDMWCRCMQRRLLQDRPRLSDRPCILTFRYYPWGHLSSWSDRIPQLL